MHARISQSGSQLIYLTISLRKEMNFKIRGVRYTRLLPSCQAKTTKKQHHPLPEKKNLVPVGPSRKMLPLTPMGRDKKRSRKQKAAPSAMQWCRDQDLNQGHSDFQSDALPTELSRRHPKWRGNYREG
jgi:hypothetical protein